MKKEFKKGDRVRVFSHLGSYVGTVEKDNLSNQESKYGKIQDRMLLIKNSAGECWEQHPRQCVRLKKKVRQVVWINEYEIGLGEVICMSQEHAKQIKDEQKRYIRTIKFIEAKDQS